MGFEIPIDVDYCDHPKVLALVAKLGKRADIFPLRLWLWCAKFAKKGVISGGATQIESACRWDGKPGVLHAALVESEIVDSDGLTVHDWMDHAGRQIDAYERKKRKQRRAYQRRQSDDEPPERPPDEKPPGVSPILPEECRNSANRECDESPHSANPKRKEKTTKEITTHEKKKNAATIDELAQDGSFDEGWGTDPKRIAIWRAHLVDLVASGKSLDEIADALESKPKSEPPWTFATRIGKSVSTVPDQDESNQRLREAMERQRKLMEPER